MLDNNWLFLMDFFVFSMMVLIVVVLSIIKSVLELEQPNYDQTIIDQKNNNIKNDL